MFLVVGSLSVQKDYPTSLRSFRLLRTERPCRLIVLDGGPKRTPLERLVAELDVTGGKLLAFVANPFAYMVRASVLILSSRWEDRMHVPRRCGGHSRRRDRLPARPEREILDGGGFGTPVPVGDPPALAPALAQT